MFLSTCVIIFSIFKDQESTWKRDWRHYSKKKLCERLARINWNFESDLVQDFWNELESQLITVVDELIPIVEFTNIEAKN